MSAKRRAALMLTPDEGFLDRRIAQEANTLARHGWDVDIYATHLPPQAPAGMLEPHVRMLSSVHQPRASLARRVKHRLRDGAPIIHRILDSAQSIVSDRAGQLSKWHLDALLAHGPYQVVFAHDIPVLPLAVRLKETWACPVICDFHEIYPEMTTTASSDRTRSYWRRIESTFLPLIDGLLCVNDAVEAYLRAAYAPVAPLGVVSNAAPYVREPRRAGCDIRSVYGISDDRRVLAFAGRLEPDTNVETLIKGFGQARPSGWLLALLATGPLAEHLTELVTAEGFDDRVYLGRRVPQAELIPTLASANAGALPYQPVDRNHSISTPNKLYEYAQARLPIAASKLPMIERIINDNRNGSFVDYSSATTTATGLRSFLDGVGMFDSETLDAAARALSWEREEAVFLSIVDQSLSRAGSGVATGAAIP